MVDLVLWFWKERSFFSKVIDNVSDRSWNYKEQRRDVFKTQSNFYDGAFLWK